MDGSERIEYQEEVVAEVPVQQPAVLAYEMSQPQVIVERVIPVDVIMDDGGEEIVPTQQNGDSAEPNAGTAAATLDDIIADAVAPEADDDEVAAGEEGATAPPVTGDAPIKQQPAEEGDDKEDGDTAEEELVTPRKKEEPSLELNQCRTCTSREDLVDIFEPLKRDPGMPMSAVIVKLCSGITITKRDHLPNLICRSCIYKLEMAWEFRELCQKTDQDLRKSLPRAKKVSRKHTDYTIIDYDSSSGEDAGANDDEDEFKLSDELDEESVASDSEPDSDAAPKKRGRPKRKKPATPPARATPSARGRGRPKSAAKSTPGKIVGPKSARAPIVYVEAKDEDETESEESEEESPKPKKMPKKQCPKCKAVITGGVHQCKVANFSCSFCAEKFATHPLYMNHQQLHTNFQNANTCVRCHKQFPNKGELRKHQSGVRCHKALKNNCMNCGRVLANASQLAIHLRTKCQPPTKSSPGALKKPQPGGPASASKKREVVSPKKTPSKDPFKATVVPNSTYWSDSFSD